jgi:hypothetical protein
MINVVEKPLDASTRRNPWRHVSLRIAGREDAVVMEFAVAPRRVLPITVLHQTPETADRWMGVWVAMSADSHVVRAAEAVSPRRALAVDNGASLPLIPMGLGRAAVTLPALIVFAAPFTAL